LEPFKNLISPARIRTLGGRIQIVHPRFDSAAFLADAKRGLSDIELKQRVRHVAAALREHLPAEYPRALDVLVEMLETTPGPANEEFGLWPVCHFIEAYGLEDFESSLRAMPVVTQHCTCEFAVRPYLLANTRHALQHVRQWTEHESDSVRRLASEGIRPQLPWGQRLPMFVDNPMPVIRILNLLYRDESEFVRRSVANNLNDISKDHPQRVIETLRRWQGKPGPHFERLQHHALRTLLKQGHSEALALRGYGKARRISASLSLQRKRVRLGEALPFSLELNNGHSGEQALMIDYALHLRKSAGDLKPKVFKWTQRTLQKGEQVILDRAHALKAVTVRQYYAGEQMLEILINGKSVASARFTLTL
jgi:3-methyladenine DNA glycosylase AlkC